MTFLVIPLSQKEYSQNDFLQPIFLVDELSKNHFVIGIEKKPNFGTSNTFSMYLRLIFYYFKVFIYGIKQRKKIDIIYCSYPAYGLIGAIISFMIKIPCIWDTNEGNLLAHCQLLKTSFLFTWIHLIIEKIVGKISCAILVPSEMDRSLYIKQNFKYIDKVIVVPYGINLSFIDKTETDKLSLRKKLNINPYKKVLIYTGKREYLPNKEAAFWINDELAPQLAQKYDDIQILILGSGDIPYHVHPIVTFTGFVPSVYEYILASDLCIVPYLLNTGISLKVLDAMACSKPVITMSVVAELFGNLVDNENIIIAKDRKDFINKTIWALQYPNIIHEIGINARNTVESFYNLESIAKNIECLLESCTKNKSKIGEYDD
jgi:glycosyltransferase involved in cell wall biosynthesis